MLDDARSALSRIRNGLAEKGHEKTPDEVIDILKDINEKAEKDIGMTLLDLYRVRKSYEPPPPPYAGYWDDEKEALAFKKSVEEFHKIKLIAFRDEENKIRILQIEE